MSNDVVKVNSGFCVEVDESACKECGYCTEVCPKGIFVIKKSFNEKGYRPVDAVDTEKCIGCLKCFYICPDFAIDVKEKRKEGEEK
ncbi:MAG: 4Fe-4S dicluster domain-containing protein [Clostridium sp.]|uniref:4Fe-4S dicluster domain-containing protein n=1 Tax=Clostridium sp. TaxID=1506 RepID=UPI0039EB28DD